jgi:hypothetical protein
MKVSDQTVEKIRLLPESLAREVDDFVDFLIERHDRVGWESSTAVAEPCNLAESDFSDYLTNLEDYEGRLERGEIKW